MKSLLFLLLSQFRSLLARQCEFPQEQGLFRIGQRCSGSLTDDPLYTVGKIILNIKLFVQFIHSS